MCLSPLLLIGLLAQNACRARPGIGSPRPTPTWALPNKMPALRDHGRSQTGTLQAKTGPHQQMAAGYSATIRATSSFQTSPRSRSTRCARPG